MNYLTNCISEEQLTEEINFEEAFAALNLKNNILMRKTECLISMNEFESVLESIMEIEKKSIVSNDKKTEGIEQKKQTDKEIDLLFQIQQIPRLPNPRRVKTSIQFNMYFIHFSKDFTISNYSFASAPQTSIEQFIKTTISKVNKQLEDEQKTSGFLRDDFGSYLLRISDENGEADDDLPPLEYSSKIGEMGTFHFVLIDNPEYFDKLKKHRRAINTAASGISAFINSKNVKIFFNIKKMENSTARYGYKDDTKVTDFLCAVIDERNKKYNLVGTEFELTKDLTNYEFKMADENGIPDDDFNVDFNSNISDFGETFVLIGKGKYQSCNDLKIMIIPSLKDTKDTKDNKKDLKTSPISNNKAVVPKKKGDELGKTQLSPRQAKTKTIMVSPRKKSGKIYTIFYQSNQLKIEFDENGSVGGFIEEILIYAFKNGIKMIGKTANDFSIYVAESNGDCDKDFELNKESQIKDMCSMHFALYSKQ